MLFFMKRWVWILNASGDNESVNCSTSLPGVNFISSLTLMVSETSLLFICEAIMSQGFFSVLYQKRVNCQWAIAILNLFVMISTHELQLKMLTGLIPEDIEGKP